MDHHYSLRLYTPIYVLYKLNETWNVLQKEDEHHALSNADTKYGALTHIWVLKTTQNEFNANERISYSAVKLFLK